jgi:AmmeMemoRadiSam system protein A
MAEMDERVKLALSAIRAYVKDRHVIDVPENTCGELLSSQAGVFVCLKKHGQLRGCIGTIEAAQDCVAEEIVANAISAASQDPRFLPVDPNELDELECSVDVLTPAEECSLEDLDPKCYGVIVECKGRRGLLLPDLEGVDNAEEQVDIARRKAGIGSHDEIKLYRFEVIRYK